MLLDNKIYKIFGAALRSPILVVVKMEKWFISNKKADFELIGRRFGISPVLAKLITNRGIIGEDPIQEYLFGDLADLHSPHDMKDLDKAVFLIKSCILSNKKIRVVQDYDVDGCMSAYILVDAIQKCGGIVDYDVPDRTTEGYGINERIILKAWNDGVDTLLTCDNGIAALNEVKAAKKLGMTVIVSDHHEVQYTEADGKIEYRIPEADAVVDPKRPDCAYPFKHLCGAGVAYKIAEVLYHEFSVSSGELRKLLQYAAVATICDIVDLTGENRIITKEGLKVLEQTDNFGMRALLERCLKEGEKISVGRIGFFIGPVINAGGRMSTAFLVMDLLFSKSKAEAEKILDELILHNNERKKATEDAVDKILKKFSENPVEDSIIIEYMPECHESVAGIAAGRIKDLFYKPTIILTDSNEDEYIKGSARSVEGFDIFERIMTVSDLLYRFGGHPMAAGLTFKRSYLEEFVKRINAPGWPEGVDRYKRIVIDAAVPFSSLSRNLIEEFELLEPCGKGNKKALLAAKGVKIFRAMIMGKNKNALKLTLDDGSGSVVDGIWFGNTEHIMKEIREKFGDIAAEQILSGKNEKVFTDIIYAPKINNYNGFERIQLDITAFRW